VPYGSDTSGLPRIVDNRGAALSHAKAIGAKLVFAKLDHLLPRCGRPWPTRWLTFPSPKMTFAPRATLPLNLLGKAQHHDAAACLLDGKNGSAAPLLLEAGKDQRDAILVMAWNAGALKERYQ
jgi:hypothetical protein